MLQFYYVNTLRKGDVFRDWLLNVVGEKIKNNKCDVAVYKIHSSHTVCRYEFIGENYSVIGKFFSEPKGNDRYYDYYLAMMHEWHILNQLQNIVDIPKPLAIKKNYNCVLLTEYINGYPVSVFSNNKKDIIDKFETIGKTMRRIHLITQRYYDKGADFHKFITTLKDCKLEPNFRSKFESLLKIWWKSDLLDQDIGCTIHGDASPNNYIFYKNKCYPIDFEGAMNHANAIYDLGIMCAEVTMEFIRNNKQGALAQPYIKSLLNGYNSYNNASSLGFLRGARFLHNSHHKNKICQQALASLSL